MTSVFRNNEGELFTDFMEKGTIIQTLTLNSLHRTLFHPHVDKSKKIPIICVRMFKTESEL